MKRDIGEDFDAYKERRKKENLKLKNARKGRMIWQSNRLGTHPVTKLVGVIPNSGMTYKKKVNGVIGTPTIYGRKRLR